MGDYTDPVLIPMLTAATLINTVSDPVPLNNCRQHWHSVKIRGATTAGVWVVEIAPERDFAGLWEPILSMDIAAEIAASTAGDGVFTAQLAAGDVERQISWPGPGGFVRHRIPTAITGGANHTITSVMRRIMLGANGRVLYITGDCN